MDPPTSHEERPGKGGESAFWRVSERAVEQPEPGPTTSCWLLSTTERCMLDVGKVRDRYFLSSSQSEFLSSTPPLLSLLGTSSSLLAP